MRYLIIIAALFIPTLAQAVYHEEENKVEFVMLTVLVGSASIDVFPDLNNQDKSVIFPSNGECEAALLAKMKKIQDAAVWIEQETFSITLYVGCTDKQCIERATTCMPVIR